MKTLEKKISTFAQNPDNIMQAYALLKVGRDNGDGIEKIMATLIAHVLLEFHGIPITPPTEN